MYLYLIPFLLYMLKDPALLIFFIILFTGLTLICCKTFIGRDIYIFLILVIYFLILFRIERDNYLCEFCIYIISFIILAVYLVYCLCIGSLLIYVDCLLDFMLVSEYGSSSRPTFKLGPTRICVRL